MPVIVEKCRGYIFGTKLDISYFIKNKQCLELTLIMYQKAFGETILVSKVDYKCFGGH